MDFASREKEQKVWDEGLVDVTARAVEEEEDARRKVKCLWEQVKEQE